MAVVKDFMVRVFLVPEDKEQQGQTMLYMNFGFNGNQVLPMFLDNMFTQYFSEAQYIEYNRVSTRFQEYLKPTPAVQLWQVTLPCRHFA
jgi:hypothetical protein